MRIHGAPDSLGQPEEWHPFTGAVYTNLDPKRGFVLLDEHERAVIRLESGESLTDEQIVGIAEESADFYIDYFAKDTRSAVAYITDEVLEPVPIKGYGRVRENAVNTLFNELEAECDRTGVPENVLNNLEIDIINNWGSYTQAASRYINTAYNTFERAVGPLRQPDKHQLRSLVAGQARASFTGLLDKLINQQKEFGPLPPQESTLRRAMGWLATKGETTARERYIEQSLFYLKRYKVPDGHSLVRDALKAEYLRIAVLSFGSVPVQLRSATGDPEELYIRHSNDATGAPLKETTQALIRPKLPSELAREFVRKTGDHLLYGNSAISEAIDKYGTPARRSARGVRRLHALNNPNEHESLVRLDTPPIPARKDPFKSTIEVPEVLPDNFWTDDSSYSRAVTNVILRDVVLEDGEIRHKDDAVVPESSLDVGNDELTVRPSSIKKAPLTSIDIWRKK